MLFGKLAGGEARKEAVITVQGEAAWAEVVALEMERRGYDEMLSQIPRPPCRGHGTWQSWVFQTDWWARRQGRGQQWILDAALGLLPTVLWGEILGV